MEECKRLAADCIVVCSCGPCLVIKVAAFAFVGLPRKLVKKTRRLVSGKLRWRSRKRRKAAIVTTRRDAAGHDEVVGVYAELDLADESYDWQCPIQAAEEVLLELYERGGIGFGIFGRSFHEGSDLEEVVSSGRCVWEMYIFGDGR